MDREPVFHPGRYAAALGALTALLLTPAALQAAILLEPRMLAAAHANAAMALALAGTTVAVPAVLNALFGATKR